MEAFARQVEALTARAKALSPQHPVISDAATLAGPDLDRLLTAYAQVAPADRARPLLDGRSADEHLALGLARLEAQAAELAARLSDDEAQDLRIASRYLETKYGGPDET